jgi:hypothetical protein
VTSDIVHVSADDGAAPMSTQLYPHGIRALRFFDSLEATDFQRVEHAASLKGP